MAIERDQNDLSEFYLAARNGNVTEVERLLESLWLYDLNKIESNGSTALHAAVHYDHINVVECLIRHKAVHRKLRNAFNRLPAEETENELIKQLLGQEDVLYKSRERFIDDYGVQVMEIFPCTSDNQMEETRLKWLDAYSNASRIAVENKEYMHKWLTKVPLHKILEMINTNYIQMMTEFDQNYLDEIKMYFDYALEENDMRYLIYVYTMPSITFYKKLNRNLASRGKLHLMRKILTERNFGIINHFCE